MQFHDNICRSYTPLQKKFFANIDGVRIVSGSRTHPRSQF
jgi:hypothetical protein